MMCRICAVAHPQPGVVPDTGVAVSASIYADIHAVLGIVVVHNSVDCAVARLALHTCVKPSACHRQNLIQKEHDLSPYGCFYIQIWEPLYRLAAKNKKQTLMQAQAVLAQRL